MDFVNWVIWAIMWLIPALLIALLIDLKKSSNRKRTVFILLIMGVLCIWSGTTMFKTKSQIEAEAKIEQQKLYDTVTSQLNSAGYNSSEIRSWLSIDYVSQEGDKLTMKHYGDIDTAAMEKLNKIVQNQKENGEIEDYFIEREQSLVGTRKRRSLKTNVVILITLN